MRTTFDLYTDYLLSSFGQTTATSLSRLLEGEVSHDDVTRFLNQAHPLGPTLWRHVKPLVRQVQAPTGVLIASMIRCCTSPTASPMAWGVRISITPSSST